VSTHQVVHTLVAATATAKPKPITAIVQVEISAAKIKAILRGFGVCKAQSFYSSSSPLSHASELSAAETVESCSTIFSKVIFKTTKTLTTTPQWR
jgi:hypothetical protein